MNALGGLPHFFASLVHNFHLQCNLVQLVNCSIDVIVHVTKMLLVKQVVSNRLHVILPVLKLVTFNRTT